MLLQARGSMTAQALAEEMEVSVRTIYRDLDALSAAGVPVYAQRGPGGGCALLDSYRTTLTGLTRDEVRALFMLSIPAPLADLGVSHELKAALLKLAAALPASRRGDQEQVRQRIHLDPEEWFQATEPLPHLRTIQQALWQDRRLSLVYRLPFDAQAQWQVEPYGLVAKASTWYLVCGRGGHVRVLRVAGVMDAQVLDESFQRPAGFDLATFWGSWCADVEESRPSYRVLVRAAPNLLPDLSQSFGDEILDQVARGNPPDEEGWLRLTLPFESLESARSRLLGFGRAVEVLAPRPLRESVRDYGQQIATLYAR
jgi:predicted DNA-binding transcriptional regulator YafY